MNTRLDSKLQDRKPHRDVLAKQRGFKTCPTCSRVWETEMDFLSLAELEVLGFMANPLDAEKGFLMFNHQAENCGTTLSIPLSQLKHLIDDYEDAEDAWLSPACDGHCLTDTLMKPCDHPKCRNAVVHRFVEKLMTRETEKTA